MNLYDTPKHAMLGGVYYYEEVLGCDCMHMMEGARTYEKAGI
jgi:hypothetical protein